MERAQSAAAPPVASTVPREVHLRRRRRPTRHAGGAPVARDHGRGRRALEHLDALVARGQRRQLAGDPPAGGRAAGVHHAARGVTALEAQRQRTVAVGVEAHAHALEVADALGRLLAEHLDRARPRRPPAGRERVGGVAVGRVVHRQRGGDPALCPVAGGARQRRARHQRHARARVGGRPARRTAPRRPRPPRSRRLWGLGSATDGGYGNAIGPPLIFRHPSSLEHDTGAHPERADRIRALDAALSERDWLGYEPREAPAADEEALLAVHPRAHLEAVRRHCETGTAFDLDTPASPGSWRRGAARRGRRHRAGGRPARRRGAHRLLRPAPARPPRRGRPRDGLLPVRQHLGGGAARDRRPRRRAGAHLRLGRAPRQRHPRDLPLLAGGAVRQHPPVAVLPRHGRARRCRLGRRRGLHDQPAGAARVGRGRVAGAGGARGGAGRARVPAPT